MMVEVFKTNVQAEAQAFQLAALLREVFPGSEVSFDLEDCDKVLRIATLNLDAVQVITLVREKGYECSLLD